jgi:hypothetical protein
MEPFVQQLKSAIEPVRNNLLAHPVYSQIQDLQGLQRFSETHVFAVWDFMSLLKSLQIGLTSVTLPWVPVGNADTRYLINEIVVGEESDLDQNGKRISHFELYLEAMNQSGADTKTINKFINELQQFNDFNQAYQSVNMPKAVAEFIDFTFKIINSKKTYLQAAIFTFGREDLIPDMFMSIINEIDKKFPNEISIFKYYIERHIEVDGGHHSHLAIQMTENLCGNNPEYWQEAEQAILLSLKMRIKLWDAIYEQIKKKNELINLPS